MANPVNISVLDAVLKDYYIGPLQEQLNQEVMVLDMFEKAKISWAGKQGVVPVHVGRNSGVDFKAEGAPLPTAGSQTTKRLTFQAAYLYGRFEVTGPAIAAAAKGGTASFIGALELERVAGVLSGSSTSARTRLLLPRGSSQATLRRLLRRIPTRGATLTLLLLTALTTP